MPAVGSNVGWLCPAPPWLPLEEPELLVEPPCEPDEDAVDPLDPVEPDEVLGELGELGEPWLPWLPWLCDGLGELGDLEDDGEPDGLGILGVCVVLLDEDDWHPWAPPIAATTAHEIRRR